MSIFTDDFKDTPYWWERTPRPQLQSSEFPRSTNILVVGSGYTGLHAAIQTAQRGLQTLVVDAEDAGWGCSSRNGGQISTSIKPSYKELSKKYGAESAMEILKEGNNALNWVESFTRDNNIDCDFRRVGRFYGAHSAKALDTLRTKIEDTPKELGHDAYIVERPDQHTEIGSDFYHGGLVNPHHASLDPARYHQGILNCALDKGVDVVGNCKVNQIRKQGNSFIVSTSKGEISASKVIIATSGYTGNLTPWQQKRIIPIGSYVIATEPLADGVAESLIPQERVVTDTLKLVVYYRTCPERKRVVFGGRVSLKETDPKVSAPRLRELMLQRFPQLHSAKISHSWMGFVGYTFDHMPHIGQHDGLYYSMGYCGSGISLASYLGMKVGLKALDDAEGNTAIDNLQFPGRKYYSGNPWFLAPSIFYYRWQDKRRSSK